MMTRRRRLLLSVRSRAVPSRDRYAAIAPRITKASAVAYQPAWLAIAGSKRGCTAAIASGTAGTAKSHETLGFMRARALQ